jgi:hypothetical protein
MHDEIEMLEQRIKRRKALEEKRRLIAELNGTYNEVDANVVYIPASELAKELKMKTHTVSRYVREGYFPKAIKTRTYGPGGLFWALHPEDVERFKKIFFQGRLTTDV